MRSGSAFSFSAFNSGVKGMRRLFEQSSKLPRSQQEKIPAVLEAFVNQHSDLEA